MKYPKRSQYKYAKSRYRVRNSAEYEAGLRSRGDLTVWLSDTALDAGRAPASGKPGGQRTYADIAIEAALTIRMVFHLPLRHTEGFLRSVAQLLELDLPIPDHTTLSRRLEKLNDIRFRRLATDRPIDDRVASVSADGAYDAAAIYEAAQVKNEGHTVRVLIPPGRSAQLNPRPSAAQRERNRNIRSIRELGRREWHKRSGYSGRAMVENAVYRYKTILGRRMRSRPFAGQRVEVLLA